MLPSSPIFDNDAIKRSEQEAATGAPAPDEALLTLVAHLVKQPKPFDIFGRLVAFADTTLQDGSLMQLAIMAALCSWRLWYRTGFTVYCLSTRETIVRSIIPNPCFP